METLRFLLLPLGLMYGFVVRMRNKLFDWRVLPSEQFDIPVITVGNLVAGGSGKTPLVEYLIRLLAVKKQIATLSRGYKRTTKGYRLATGIETSETLGDEPMQYFQKFGNIKVAVCERRRKGIHQLLKIDSPPELIILDDAFQHRYIKPGLSILVTDYFKTFNHDFLLPVGRLREHRSASKRADLIVVTKTPRIFSPIVRKQMLSEMKLLPGQMVCFSYINYLEPVPLYEMNKNQQPLIDNVYSIVLLTGIANSDPLEEHVKRLCSDLELMKFPDHHAFTEKELQIIRDRFLTLPTRRKIILTTEKDAMRLQHPEARMTLGDLPVFYIPITFEFFPKDKEIFEKTVFDFLKKYK